MTRQYIKEKIQNDSSSDRYKNLSHRLNELNDDVLEEMKQCLNSSVEKAATPWPVYLDWPAGTLSFCIVSSDTLNYLHTFPDPSTVHLRSNVTHQLLCVCSWLIVKRVLTAYVFER